MDNPQKFTNSKDVIAFLAETFPACFSVEGEAKPLKIGIFQDLASRLSEDERVSKTLLRSSLRHYTNSWRYLHSVKEGAYRVDLDGNQDAAIEKEHADHAQQQLEESKAKVAERRKEQKKQQPEKKSYKNKASPNGHTTLNKRHADKAKPAGRPMPEKLTDATMKVGTEVTVKLGKSPMFATITEVAKDGVQVQLNSGMVVKVQVDQLRLARPKR
ncbi:RNA chaperone ProQ [Aestuariibacter halophilus]|uniref:RNA chaperone ProQ n=1 Tax=Fluctibacter halophilus TaxID=226011 RepID=A0ABS8G537_9ALTE|nr:RNA chaperone ProQ [Aestuariibacter halophilus]MCC2615665.1 RNA chaperone ProQ [Aestuariibacter halophilus]